MRRIFVGHDSYSEVDDDVFNLVSHITWRLDSCRKYVITKVGSRPNRKTVYLHRFVLGVNDPSVLVDHADRNPLNNLRSNLRICNNSQNQANRLSNTNKSTGKFKGVFFRKNKNAWVSEITFKGKRHYLGFFKNENDAALAYNRKALEFFGDFALLNEVNDLKESLA